MRIREAQISDIPGIQIVRHAVTENRLSDPGMVTNADCETYLSIRGKGWVCEQKNQIIGFAIADLEDHNIWALFVLPECQGKGIGKRLHDTMLNWYFSECSQTIWLSTASNTRAEHFYRMHGWQETGLHSANEIRFEMSSVDWNSVNQKK